MSDVFSRIAACIACTYFFYVATYKSLGALQQCGYQNGKFARWLKKKDNLYYNRLALWAGLALLSTARRRAQHFPLRATKTALLRFRAFPFLPLLSCSFASRTGSTPSKVPVAATGRIKRLTAVYVLLTACVSYLVIALARLCRPTVVDSELYALFAYLPFTLMPLLLPWLLMPRQCFADGLYETPRKKRFVRRAKDGYSTKRAALCAWPSWAAAGRPPSRIFLQRLLSAKYSRRCRRPNPINTPVGIAKTVTSGEFADKQVSCRGDGGAPHRGHRRTLRAGEA